MIVLALSRPGATLPHDPRTLFCTYLNISKEANLQAIDGRIGNCFLQRTEV